MKENRSKIMRLAWSIVRETRMSISYGLKVAWRNFKLQTAMKTEVVKFVYMKVSGGIREARGTLCGQFVPGGFSMDYKSKKKPNEDVLCYFDMDRNAWRSFRKSNLVSMTL